MSLEIIDENRLRLLVEAFYAEVRADEELGPIFNDAIDDWPSHLARLTDFWTSVILGSGRYKGQPVPAHLKHKDRMSPELFERWLGIWARTTETMVEPAAANALQIKARRIAQSLQLALFFRIDAPKRETAVGGAPIA